MEGWDFEVFSGKKFPGEKKKKKSIQSHKNMLTLTYEMLCVGKNQDFISGVQLTSIYIIKILIAT